MEHDTKQPQWSTSDDSSFAFPSARDRWPIILTQAIDDVHKAISRVTDEQKVSEGKKLVADLATLKYELQHNRELTPLPEDGSPDIAGYNAELARRSPLKWHSAPWLFSECYLYRRMAGIFLSSNHWKSYDYFAAQKESTFRASKVAVLELAAKYNAIAAQLSDPGSKAQTLSDEDRREADLLLFTEMAEICLWGNATDLSLLASASYVDIASLQGSEARRKAEKNILVNDVGRAFAVLDAARTNASKDRDVERRVDIVLDNSGFELFVDLVLAAYLLRADLATVVVFHPKNMPWFVSDVMPTDFAALFSALLNGDEFFSASTDERKGLTPDEKSQLTALANDWTELYADGKMVLRPNAFWTEGGSFWRLPGTASALYEDLKESELVVFKGDLNYRKLTADAQWSSTTPFSAALGPLGAAPSSSSSSSPSSGLRILALRTCKADVVVGLPPGRDEQLRREQGDGSGGRAKWCWTGKWALIQFSDGKASS